MRKESPSGVFGTRETSNVKGETILFGAAAALAERRVSALLGWAGENGGLLAHPKRLFSVVPSLNARDGYRGQNEFSRNLLTAAYPNI
jgi:hypothetical protein